MQKRGRNSSQHEWCYVEAILDVVSFDPSALRHLYIDATVRNLFSKRYLDAGSASSAGVALSIAADQKLKRYPDLDGLHCMTAGIDQYGCISVDFFVLLQQLAAQASISDFACARPRCDWLRKWTRQLSLVLALVQASAVCQTAGRLAA